jgi:LL-H family phage holin
MENLHAEIINLVIIVLTGCVGYMTTQITKYLKKKGLVAQLENNKEVTKVVVSAVEQMYTHLKGDEKLNLAKMELVKLAKQNKIKMSEKDIDIMIEAMVGQMNKSAKEELKK